MEAAGGAALGRGVPGVVHGMKSYMLQDEVGQISEAHSISAGLDYPGVGPEHAHLAAIGRARYEPAGDAEVLDAFRLLSETEGIIPALEPAHALAWVMREAGHAMPLGIHRPRHLVGPGRQGRGPGAGPDAVDGVGRRWRPTCAPGATPGASSSSAYVTGGMSPDWLEAVHAVADAGADAVEVGIPFSDPMIDGPTIQEASWRPCNAGRRRRTSSMPWPAPRSACRCAS